MPGHVEDVFPQSLEIALPRDVTEHDDAALRGASRRTQHGCGQAQHAPLPRAQLDLLFSDARARAEGSDEGEERCGDLARRCRPLLEPLLLEWLADDEARVVQAEELPGRPVQSHDGAPCVNDEEGVVHGREDRFQLQSVSLVLQGHLLRRANAFDDGTRLHGDGAQAEEIRILVGFGPIALRREHTEHPIAGQDRDHDAGLRRDQLSSFGPVDEVDRGSFGRPATHEPGFSRSNDLARETLAQRERTAGELDPAVHLADDLHGGARLVVEREEKDRRIHHARSLFMESAEQLRQVAGAGSERSEPIRKIESRAKLLLARSHSSRHLPPTVWRYSAAVVPDLRSRGKGPFRLILA